MVTSWRTFGGVVLVAAAVATVCGCGMTQEEQASLAAASMQETRAEVDKVAGHIDATMTALNNLVEKPQANLKPQYEAFTSTIEGLTAQADLVKKRADGMRKQGAAYFKAWGKDPDAPVSPELKASYDKIAGEWAKARDAFVPFLDSLGDVQKILGMDLSAAGLLLVADSVKKANGDAQEVKGRIGAVSRELDTVAKLLAPAPSK